MLEKMNYSNITLDMDLSSDLSTLNKEDDSPITDRIDRSFIEVGDLSFEPALESPPLSHVHDSLDFKKPKLLSSDKLMKTDFFSRKIITPESHYSTKKRAIKSLQNPRIAPQKLVPVQNLTSAYWICHLTCDNTVYPPLERDVPPINWS